MRTREIRGNSPKDIQSPVGRYFMDPAKDHFPDLRAPAAISAPDAVKLCQKLKIDPVKFSILLIEHLNFASQTYWVYRRSELTRIPNQTIKSEIRKILNRVESLEAALKSLSPQSGRKYWAPERNINSLGRGGGLHRKFEGDPIQFDKGPMGHTLISVRYEPDKVWTRYLERDDHFESLEILKTYANFALGNFYSTKNGRPKSEALNLLVQSNMNFWTDTLGRKFGADYKNGSAANPATHFVVSLAEIADPDLSEKQIVTAIREEVRKRRKLRSLKNVPQK